MPTALVIGGTGFVGRHTVAESIASDRDGSVHDPGRDAEAELLDALAG